MMTMMMSPVVQVVLRLLGRRVVGHLLVIGRAPAVAAVPAVRRGGNTADRVEAGCFDGARRLNESSVQLTGSGHGLSAEWRRRRCAPDTAARHRSTVDDARLRALTAVILSVQHTRYDYEILL